MVLSEGTDKNRNCPQSRQRMTQPRLKPETFQIRKYSNVISDPWLANIKLQNLQKYNVM